MFHLYLDGLKMELKITDYFKKDIHP